MFTFILSPFTRVVALVGSVLAAIGMVFMLGSRDGARQVTLRALKEAQRANEKAAAARRASARQSDSGGLRQDDGYRRD